MSGNVRLDLKAKKNSEMKETFFRFTLDHNSGIGFARHMGIPFIYCLFFPSKNCDTSFRTRSITHFGFADHAFLKLQA